MKKGRIFVTVFAASILIIALLLFINKESRSTSLPASLRNLQVPENGFDGQLIPMGNATYYGYDARCFSFIVRENRTDDHSRLIALPVIQIPATGKAGEPVFHLSGGPGMTNMRFTRFGSMIYEHDFVLLGYRGVDGTVNLQANNVVNALRKAVKTELLSDDSLREFKEAAQADYIYMTKKGIDLNGYNMLEVTDDMENLRKALGYKRINILSESYGTRLAQIYASRYGTVVKRSIMIGVNPPGHFLFSPQATDNIIRHYSSLYKSEKDLTELFTNVIPNIPEKWLWFNLNKGSIETAVFMSLFYTEGSLNSSLVFEALDSADEGDYSGLAFLSLIGKLVFPTASNWGDLFSKAVSADAYLVHNYRNQFTPDNAILGAPISKLHWSAMESWPVKPIDEIYRKAQDSEVETLLISGSVDISTPAVFAEEELLPTLKRGNHFVLKEYGHTNDFYNIQPEAADTLLSAYFRDGSVKKDLFTYNEITFDTSLTFGMLMKIISAVFVAVPPALALILLLIINRIGKKKIKAPLPGSELGPPE